MSGPPRFFPNQPLPLPYNVFGAALGRLRPPPVDPSVLKEAAAAQSAHKKYQQKFNLKKRRKDLLLKQARVTVKVSLIDDKLRNLRWEKKLYQKDLARLKEEVAWLDDLQKKMKQQRYDISHPPIGIEIQKSACYSFKKLEGGMSFGNLLRYWVVESQDRHTFQVTEVSDVSKLTCDPVWLYNCFNSRAQAYYVPFNDYGTKWYVTPNPGTKLMPASIDKNNHDVANLVSMKYQPMNDRLDAVDDFDWCLQMWTIIVWRLAIPGCEPANVYGNVWLSETHNCLVSVNESVPCRANLPQLELLEHMNQLISASGAVHNQLVEYFDDNDFKIQQHIKQRILQRLSLKTEPIAIQICKRIPIILTSIHSIVSNLTINQ